MIYTHEAGFAYTVATGKCYCPVDVFHRLAEDLLGRSVWMHELADKAIWQEMRDVFEECALEAVNAEMASSAPWSENQRV